VPTYSYACTACEHRFEVQQSFTEDTLTQCPQCEGRLRKLFNSVGIVFKGSGFYRTDSRSGNGAGGEKSSEQVSDTSADKSSGDKSSADKSTAGKTGGSSDKTGGSSDSGSSPSSTGSSSSGSTPTSSSAPSRAGSAA
jgi:putative FmdB family regulatory protein